MKTHVRKERPIAWKDRKLQAKRGWTVPFLAVDWIWEWVAYALSHWTFLEVLDYLETFSVLIAVIFYFSESGDRVKQRHYQAWQVVNTSQGKGGSGGRIEALQELNADRVALVGVDVSGAFLQGINLDKARLLRANFSAADARESRFASADFTSADLRSANFRGSDLSRASFQGAILDESDLTGANLSLADLSGASLAGADVTDADLRGLRWEHISNIKNANIFGVKNAPSGFVEWATKHGAQNTAGTTQ
ncbi:MAG TPA: pentapeptide repeat-containing protein [Candidatus Methylomirabilis sp.]|nr:pentapeptide repeat-containing protein [Candidatus Methylomirabilis sp.]